jgi:hypothetical protein
VEHPCYKCGAQVEEGVAFCPQCNAPLIRVATPIADTSADVIEATPPFLPTIPIPSSHGLGLQWSRAFAPAAMAGIVASAITLLPLGAFFGMFIGGALSVILYRWREPGSQLTNRMGARLGAMSGAFGFAVFIVFAAIAASLPGGGAKLQEALQQSVDLAAKRSSDPAVAQQMLQMFKSPEGLAALMLIGLAVTFVGFVILSSLGGLLSAAWVRRRQGP